MGRQSGRHGQGEQKGKAEHKCNGGRREWSLDSGFPMDNSGNCLSNLPPGPLASLDRTVRANGTKVTPCCFPTQNTCLENCFHPSRLSSVTAPSRKPSLTAICLPGYFLLFLQDSIQESSFIGLTYSIIWTPLAPIPPLIPQQSNSICACLLISPGAARGRGCFSVALRAQLRSLPKTAVPRAFVVQWMRVLLG